MNQMKPSLRAYILGVMGAGGTAVLVSLLAAPPIFSRDRAILATLLVSLQALAHLAPVRLAPKRQVVFGTPLQVVALLLLPVGAAGGLIAVGVALGNWQRRRPWFNGLFNAAQVALAVVAAGIAYRLVAAGTSVAVGAGLRGMLAVVAAGIVLYLVSTLAVDVAAAIQRRRSPFAGWLAVHGSDLAPHATLVAIGAAVAMTVGRMPWLMLVTVAAVAAVRLVLHTSMRFGAEIIGIAEQIADAVDARRPYMAGNSRRVAELAARVAERHGLPADACRQVSLAARLRDIGAALIPAHISDDTGVYDDEQRTYLQRHATDGADYVADVLRLPGIADAIRFHHERYDGRGYPNGLGGADIPLESRIVAACDAWVALTSERGYRPALTEQQALLVLRAGAGTQWDPEVVATVMELVRDPASVAATRRVPAMAGAAFVPAAG